MTLILSISPTTAQRGYRQVSPMTRRFATRLMRRLRHPFHQHRHHTTVASTSERNDCGHTWVVDSGASRHFSGVSSDFTSLKLDNHLLTVSGINCKIEGSDRIFFFVRGRLGKPVHMNMINVLFVPSLASRSGGSYLNLMSVRLEVHAGYKFIFSRDSDLLEHDNVTKIDLTRSNGLTWLPNHFLPTSAVSITQDFIHRLFGYLHEDGLLKLNKLGVRGALGFAKLPDMQLCPSCAIGKSRVADINRKSTRDNDPLEPFHTAALDIWGPMSATDLNGNRWALGAACYKTSSVLCPLMKSK